MNHGDGLMVHKNGPQTPSREVVEESQKLDAPFGK